MKPWKDAQVWVGGVMFDGREFTLEPGVYFSDIDGVDGGGEVSYSDLSNRNRVGVVDTEGRRDSPRIITLTGFVYDPNPRSHERRVSQIAHILAAGAGWMSWQKENTARRARVRRFGGWNPVRDGNGFTDFTISFRAPDQRIFGDATTSPWVTGSVTLPHYGGYPAPVTLRVRGTSSGGWVATGPTGTVVVSRALASGQPHEYLGDEGVLLVNGAAVTSGVARSDVFEAPPGACTFEVSNGLEFQVSFPETYAP